MKKVAILLFFITITWFLKAQVAYDDITVYNKNYTSLDVSKIADDSTYWFRIRGNIPIDIGIDFTNFSNDSCTVDFYMGYVKEDSVFYNSIDLLNSFDFPITMVKARYQNTVESDTMSCIIVEPYFWMADLIGVKLNPTAGTTGNAKIFINR